MVSYGNSASQLGNGAAGFGLVGNGMGSTLPIDLEMVTSQTFQTSAYSTQDIAYSFHTANNSQITQEAQFQSYQNDSINPTFDPQMSFRDRHRFLDGIYNASPDPDAISAKNFESISRRAGLSMEEVLSWFGDERERRAKLLAGKNIQVQDLGSQFPLSPADTTTPPQNSTVTLSMSQCAPSYPPEGFGKLDDIFSPPAIPSTPRFARFAVPEKAKRGRPGKASSSIQAPSLPPVAKRQKQSIAYPCPDCKKLYAAERWVEHVKRVHFPDQVWECQKINSKTGKPCGYGPASRADNFGTHLRTEHNSDDTEIAHLKEVSKFIVVGFFHHVCGFCGEIDALATRDESIEHIKEHFKEVSLRAEVPADKGISEWTDRCGNPHILTRGIHYKIDEEGDNSNLDAPGEDDDTGNSNGSSQGSQEDSQEKSQDSSDQGPSSGNSTSFTDDTSLDSSQGSSFFTCGQSTTHFAASTRLKQHSSFGLEGLDLPFISIRKLGSGGHGSVDEVISTSSMEHFARKSVTRLRTTATKSTRMIHLKNELTILKELNHPNLVKLIGAYTDELHSHLIMSPVADQNLADFMRMPKDTQPNRFLEWMSDLSSAMAYLHNKNVKHLDVKPQNILVKGQQVLLADFGTAESLLFKEHSSVAKTVAVTPMYCAPEIIHHGQQDYPADIFSLGCVFSEMLTCYFGKSLEEFENFRSKGGKKIFHLAHSETDIWISDLLDHQTPSLALRLADKIMQMLREVPTHRPTANALCLLFSDSCTSAPRNEGQSMSSGHPVQTKTLALAETLLQEKRSTPQDPLYDDIQVGAQEKNETDGPGSITDAASLLMQLGRASRKLPEDQDEAVLGDADLHNHQQKEGISKRVVLNIPDGLQSDIEVIDLTNRAFSVALSDKVPSLSSSVTSGRDSMSLGPEFTSNLPIYDIPKYVLESPSLGCSIESRLPVPEYLKSPPLNDSFQSRYPEFSSNASIFSIPEYLESPALEYCFQPLGIPTDYLENLQLYPEYRSSQFVYPSFIHPTDSYSASHEFHKENVNSRYFGYPYPGAGRMSPLPSLSSSSSFGTSTSDESREKGRCTYPECGKVFKDLKAHVLTHRVVRPEKCPLQTCEYHIKGFARKYDKNRHILTHYKGTMVCGFCPGSGSAAEKSFNRADVFKRHLTSVHAVELTPPNSRKKTNLVSRAPKLLAGYAPGATGKCSTCTSIFSNAQDFYEHLDDCVLRIVQQEDPSEAINAARRAEVEPDCTVQETLAANLLPVTTNHEDSGDDTEGRDKSGNATSLNPKVPDSHSSPRHKARGLTHSKGDNLLATKSHKKRKDYPSSWGYPASGMKMKKRVLSVFDGPRRVWKDLTVLDPEYEARMRLGNDKAYVTDLDIETLQRADGFLNSTQEEKGPWTTDDLSGVDLERLMGVGAE